MKTRIRVLCMLAVAGLAAFQAQAVPTEAELKAAVETYYNDLFQRLGKVAEQNPTVDTFRDLMKPQIEKIDGSLEPIPKTEWFDLKKEEGTYR